MTKAINKEINVKLYVLESNGVVSCSRKINRFLVRLYDNKRSWNVPLDPMVLKT